MFAYLKLFYFLLRPRTIFLRRTSKAMGDNLLLTILLPFLKKRYPGSAIIVETNWTDLFLNNPYVTWVTDKHFKTTKRHIKAKYHIDTDTTESIYEQILSKIDIREKSSPRLYLLDEEIAVEKDLPEKYIVVCPQGKATFTANRKEWGIGNFQKLRDMLLGYSWVQVGNGDDTLLERVIDRRGLPIRRSAAIIQNSLFFIGLEGGLMHLSKAVNARACIIYGGFIKPEISGYDDHLIISNQVFCSPCFHSNEKHDVCDTMICMKGISPELVFDELKKNKFIQDER